MKYSYFCGRIIYPLLVMTFKIRFVRLFLAFFLFAVCPGFSAPRYPFSSVESEAYADSVLQTLSLEERIGQLFVVYAETTWDEKNLNYFYRQWENAEPGGIILFRGGPKTVRQFIKNSQERVKVPLLFSVDGEYGLSMRMDSFPSIPYNMVLGAVDDNRIVMEAGAFVGSQCHELGIHINFAPVLDLNNNPDNPVINYRSFGEDLQNVADKGYAYLYGMQQYGVLGVGKHFPGHGNTATDSHYDLPVINGTYPDLYNAELRPFEKLANRGLKAVMVGHLNVPALDNTGQPATLSAPIIQGVLRDSLGFGGLVITDGMNMGAVTRGYEQPFVKALQAGNDVLLLPANYAAAKNEVLQAVKSGGLDAQLISDKCRRVLMAKYVLIEQQKLKQAAQAPPAAEALNEKIYQHAVTLLKNENSSIPFSQLAGKKVALIENTGSPSRFSETVQFYHSVEHYHIRDLEQQPALLQKLAHYDLVIFGLHGNLTGRQSNYGISQDAVHAVGQLAEHAPVAVVLMANPYVMRAFSMQTYTRVQNFIVGYDSGAASQLYCAQVLFGGASAQGRLSVSVEPFARVGDGLFSRKNRMGFVHKNNGGFHPAMEDSIRQIVQEAIDDKAMPGCQILVARDGEIVLQQSYGYHTYENKLPVKNTDVYDLASVTKIVATLPLFMQMDERGEVHLNETLSTYFPDLTGTNKANISMRDMLRHTAGFAPHIAFQFAFVDPVTVKKYGLINNRSNRVFQYRIDQSLYVNRYFKYYPSLFNKRESKYFPIKVANNMYASTEVLDSIWTRIDSSEVSPGNLYKYSDLGYYYLQKLIENKTHTPLDELAATQFYNKLGMARTAFKPLELFPVDEIVPTENDTYFRKQLLLGYVHDQGAAMMGGVAGHAGLFSNAGDLAKMMQMYLNGGQYGGEQFFTWNTLHYYSSDTDGDGRRAIGFDKPEPDSTKVGPTCLLASPESYGHSGFTGTYVWVDPAYNLIYIFLSNRIHPDAYNTKLIKNDVRTRIQEQIYKAIL